MIIVSVSNKNYKRKYIYNSLIALFIRKALNYLKAKKQIA